MDMLFESKFCSRNRWVYFRAFLSDVETEVIEEFSKNIMFYLLLWESDSLSNNFNLLYVWLMFLLYFF